MNIRDRSDNLRAVGLGLRALRQLRGETQAETATAIGVSRQYVSEVEGGRNITLDLVFRFSAHFGVPPSAIVEPNRKQ
ncbi:MULTISPECIES: helix-turn-helix transcriptional regulator [Gordonia]|uniref:helix-turn-helix transcriptional regulator n=1 Tax=Gordonia TaxID=2053 RepID=UPI00068A9DF3|nr:helix-turn-helix transcriptional regulator [Gordonia amicalis]NKX79817.1 helix-turn-helix transcriptional regulator [Gordonia amicalis]